MKQLKDRKIIRIRVHLEELLDLLAQQGRLSTMRTVGEDHPRAADLGPCLLPADARLLDASVTGRNQLNIAVEADSFGDGLRWPGHETSIHADLSPVASPPPA